MTVCALLASATDYTDNLVVTVDENSTEPMPATITVERLDNGNINVLLKNFILSLGGESLPVGNINVENIEVVQDNELETFDLTDKAVTVTAGEPADANWVGPLFFANGLNIDISGKFTDSKFYCTLDLTFGTQVIHVTFGTDEFQTAAKGTDYTDNLVVTVDGNSTEPIQATITVERLDNGNINVLLKNFILSLGGESLPVGNINVENIEVVQDNGLETFDLTDKAVTVTAGEPADANWVGPLMFANGLNIDISGKFTDSKFYCTLDLTFGTQVIHVTFGTDEFPSNILSAQTADPNKTVNVYSILGVQVKSNVKLAEALDGLQRGIYIVDGKKVIKK